MNKTNRHSYLFFWGHQPKKDGSISKSCLSQWYPSLICSTIGDNFPTAEHYMMTEKALLFDDKDTYQQILHASSAQEAKMLGRSVKNFNENIWQQNRYAIALTVNYEKFRQNPQLRAFLYSTRGLELVEASPNDTIWGIGLSADNPDAQNHEKWRGLNLLGKALTEVRENLYAKAIVLPISTTQWLEIDICKQLNEIDYEQDNTPIWFVNHNEPRFDIADHFYNWKTEISALESLILAGVKNAHNSMVTLDLSTWSAWTSYNPAPTITLTLDQANEWLQKITSLKKSIDEWWSNYSHTEYTKF